MESDGDGDTGDVEMYSQNEEEELRDRLGESSQKAPEPCWYEHPKYNRYWKHHRCLCFIVFILYYTLDSILGNENPLKFNHFDSQRRRRCMGRCHSVIFLGAKLARSFQDSKMFILLFFYFLFHLRKVRDWFKQHYKVRRELQYQQNLARWHQWHYQQASTSGGAPWNLHLLQYYGHYMNWWHHMCAWQMHLSREQNHASSGNVDSQFKVPASLAPKTKPANSAQVQNLCHTVDLGRVYRQVNMSTETKTET